MYRIKVRKVFNDKTELQRKKIHKAIEKYGVPKEIHVDYGYCKINKQQERFKSIMMYLIDNNASVFDGKRILFIEENIPKPIVQNARAKALERFTCYFDNIFNDTEVPSPQEIVLKYGCTREMVADAIKQLKR